MSCPRNVATPTPELAEEEDDDDALLATYVAFARGASPTLFDAGRACHEPVRDRNNLPIYQIPREPRDPRPDLDRFPHLNIIRWLEPHPTAKFSLVERSEYVRRWACHCGHEWRAWADRPPLYCPSCFVKCS